MAGSRVEKFGSIYTRARGLLKAGALSEADKPLWLDIHEAFPPKVQAVQERRLPDQKVRNILYPEDIIRARFYKIYNNPDVVNLSDHTVKTTCQRFVEKYMELLGKAGGDAEELFDSTVTALKEEGVSFQAQDLFQSTSTALRKEGQRLRTNEDIKQVKLDVDKAVAAVIGTRTAEEVFGKKTLEGGDEDTDFVSELDEEFTKKR